MNLVSLGPAGAFAAKSHKLKDQLDKAVREFQNAIRLQPDRADAHCTLGVPFWQRGGFDTAIGREADGDRESACLRGGLARHGFKTAGKDFGGGDGFTRGDSFAAEFCRGSHTTLAAVLRQSGDSQGAAEEAKAGAKITASTNHLQAATFSTNSEKRLLGAGDVDGAIA